MLSKISIDRFIFLMLLLNSSLLLIPSKFKVYPILLFFSAAIIFRLNTLKTESFSFKYLFIIGAIVYIYLGSYIFSSPSYTGFLKLSTMASLIAYPLIFGLLKQSNFYLYQSQLSILFVVFISTTLIFSCGSFAYFWYVKYTFKETIIHYSNLINIALNSYNIHPIYLSLYVGLSILFVFHLFKKGAPLVQKFFLLIVVVLLFITLAILMRKGPIIFLFFAILYYLSKLYSRKTVLISSLVILITFSFALITLPKYQNFNRFYELTFNNNLSNSSTAIRSEIYNCVVSVIKESPIVGYGAGNVQKELDACYNLKNLNTVNQVYNSHNQYFSIILTAGFFGLVVFIFCTILLFKIVAKNSNSIGAAVLLFFLLNFCTENVLEREDGVLLYAFFISVFLFNNSNHKLIHKTP